MIFGSTFGETAEERQLRRDNSGGEVWIKGYKKGQTRDRFLQPTSTFHPIDEHYGFGTYFPCAKSSACVGCNADDERTRQKSLRYLTNVLDENGRVSVRKVPSKLYGRLQTREQRMGTIQDRDYTVIRTGEGIGTEYDYDAEPVSPIENDPGDRHDLKQVAIDKYLQVHSQVTGIPLSELKPVNADRPAVKDEATDTDEAQTGAWRKKIHDEPSAEPTRTDDKKPPAEWETQQLRDFLNNAQVEFPPRAPRSRLVREVEEYLDKPPF